VPEEEIPEDTNRNSNEGLKDKINEGGHSEEEDAYDGGQEDKLQWHDFNVDFHSTVPDIQDQ
jgi:hypothetical protein